MDEGRVCPLDLYLVAENRQGCIPLKPHIDAAERKNYFTAQEAYSPFSDGVIKINTAKDLCVLRVPVLHLGERQGGIPTIKKFAVGTTAGAQSHQALQIIAGLRPDFLDPRPRDFVNALTHRRFERIFLAKFVGEAPSSSVQEDLAGPKIHLEDELIP